MLLCVFDPVISRVLYESAFKRKYYIFQAHHQKRVHSLQKCNQKCVLFIYLNEHLLGASSGGEH